LQPAAILCTMLSALLFPYPNLHFHTACYYLSNSLHAMWQYDAALAGGPEKRFSPGPKPILSSPAYDILAVKFLVSEY
jgi:hypothetical protein